MVFSTSDRINQMCYCCRKLEKSVKMWEAVCQRVRKWEAVGGHAPLIGSVLWSDLSYPIREHGLPHSLSWLHMASHSLPLSDSLAHSLPHFVMWSVWANQRAWIWPHRSDYHGRSDSTGQSNAFGREISQTGPRIALLHLSYVICVGGHGSPSTASHAHSLSPIWESNRTDHMTLWWEADLWGRGSPIGPLSHLSRPVSLISWPIGLLCPVESDWHLGQPHRSASQIGFTDQPHRSASQIGLTDRTPTASQIGLTDHISKADR